LSTVAATNYTGSNAFDRADSDSDQFNREHVHNPAKALDNHTHESGKGIQIPTGGIADLAVTAAKIANTTITDGKVAAANVDGVSATASMRTLGTGAQQAAAGNHTHSETVTRLATSTLGGAAASIEFTSISGSYKTLLVVFQARGDNASSTVTLRVQFNGDTASNYEYESSEGAVDASADHMRALTNLPAASSGAGRAASGEILIPGYAETAFHQQITSSVGTAYGTNSLSTERVVGNWRNAAAITSVKLSPSAGNFAAGTMMTLYGLN
jgi:hypothetical protein